MRHTFTIAGFSMALMLFGPLGCYESVEVTWYEAGAYKGADDPLRDRLAGSELDRRLVERFRQVQTDR